MLVDVSAINKLMDYWGEDCVCFFNEEEIAIRVYGNLRYSFTPIDML